MKEQGGINKHCPVMDIAFLQGRSPAALLWPCGRCGPVDIIYSIWDWAATLLAHTSSILDQCQRSLLLRSKEKDQWDMITIEQ